MPLYMVDTYEGLFLCVCQCFCIGKADQQRAHQSRAVRHGKAVNAGKVHIRLPQRFIHDGVNAFDMLPGGYFRHDAAVYRMKVRLRRDDI
jgi:hypothetical protein